MTLEEVFEDLQVIKDFNHAGSEIVWTHRRMKGVDIYFISNQTDEAKNIRPGFRITGKQPELWNAVDGSIRILPEFSVEGRNTFVPLNLEPYQSFFIVFKDGLNPVEGKNFPEPLKMITLNGSWEVQFDPQLGGPRERVLFNELVDWKDHSDERIKFYSGTAIYTTDFSVDEIPDGEVYLDLGNVEVMARIKVNGKTMGGVWTPPFRLNITEALKAGKNNLEIEVVNLWMNRLIKDRDLPEKERLTWLSLGHDIIRKDKELFPSGLIGPVMLEVLNYW
jgi:hypothetical protein